MAPRVGLFGALLLVLLPAVATAQERRCRQVLESDARRIFNTLGEEVIYFRDPVRVLCTGDLRLEADSAVMNRTAASVQLVGNVFFQDSIRELTADWANYIGEQSQLLARGDVVLRNLEDGSVVEGDELEYRQATERQPQARMIVRGDRPYAVIPPRPDSAGAVPDTAVSTEVWADLMDFRGEEVFRAIGDVELQRGDMTGAGRTATFDQLEERMTLAGAAFVETDQYRLEGDQIDAYLSGDEVRTVTAMRTARLESDDLTVESDRIRIGFLAGRLDRMEAWNPEPDGVPRALAEAEDFRLRADSIDALADSVGIQEVRAVGRAYGERGEVASSARLPQGTARDWIQGDTILGFFARRAPGGATGLDTTAVRRRTGLPRDTTRVEAPVRPDERDPLSADSTETYLERIVVIGGQAPALSLYRMPAEEEGDPPSVNFLKASMITLFMVDGDVARVEADGSLDGVYLSPVPRGDEEAEGEGGGDEADGGEVGEGDNGEGENGGGGSG